jgi:5-oxoprolinase (ATP-hydrolysing) subunit A
MDCGENLGGLWSDIDRRMMLYLKYANIACGKHAGSLEIIESTIELAKKHKVEVGAHPSFDDRDNFGRVYVDMQIDDLETLLYEQIMIVKTICERKKVSLHHVKAHGALYNAAMKNEKEALAIVNTCAKIDPSLIIFAMPESTLATIATSHNLNVMHEVFGDRNYLSASELVPRSQNKAIVSGYDNLYKHLDNLRNGFVISNLDEKLELSFQTICYHSDQESIFDVENMLKLF